MKKRILSVLVVTLLVLSVNAQKKNAIKINPFSPLVKTFNLQYERVLNEKSSFQLGLFYTGAESGDVTLTGIGITPEYRMYLSNDKEAPAGFFIAPFVRYQNFTLKADVLNDVSETVEGKASFSAFRPGLLIGHQWLFSDKVTFEMFFGPTYSVNSVKVKSDYGTEDDFSASALDGFGLRAGFSLGFAF